MHIADYDIGLISSNGVVGGSMGIATGAAFSAQRRNTGQVCICFFGDAASNQGIFYETMNLAGVLKLPLIYVCENNLYGQYTPTRNVFAGKCIADRAKPFGIPGVTVEGMDVLSVFEATKVAVDRARSGQGPSLIEALTYRFTGHHAGDTKPPYRTDAEVAEWNQRDPIPSFRTLLLEQGICTAETSMAIDETAQRQVDEAVEFGKTSPFPSLDEVFDHVYA